MSPHDPQANDGLDDLVRRARAGDGKAKGELFLVARQFLLKLGNQLVPPELRSKGAASDLVQESFLIACRDFDHFQGRTVKEWVAWLCGIAVHGSAHFRRAFSTSKRDHRREVSLDALAALEGPPGAGMPRPAGAAEILILGEDRQLVADAVARLPGVYRVVIELRFWAGLTFSELASELGLSEKAARSLHARAVRKLARQAAIKATQVAHTML